MPLQKRLKCVPPTIFMLCSSYPPPNVRGAAFKLFPSMFHSPNKIRVTKLPTQDAVLQHFILKRKKTPALLSDTVKNCSQ